MYYPTEKDRFGPPRKGHSDAPERGLRERTDAYNGRSNAAVERQESGVLAPSVKQSSATPSKTHRRGLNREDQALLSKQTYAPASLVNKPELLRSYALLHNEFGGARPLMRPMAEIALALGCSMREARDRVVALEAEGVLVVNRRPGQESEYRLLQESKYIEMPLQIAVLGSHAVCAVWGALRIGLGRGRSALKCATAVTQMAWARIQAITGLGRTAVGKALRWLRKQGWLSRRVVWASRRPIRRAVCRWKLRLRTPAVTHQLRQRIQEAARACATPADNRPPPRQAPGQPPSGVLGRTL